MCVTQVVTGSEETLGFCPRQAQAFGTPCPRPRRAAVDGVSRCGSAEPEAASGCGGRCGSSWQVNCRVASSERGPSSAVDTEVVPRPPHGQSKQEHDRGLGARALGLTHQVLPRRHDNPARKALWSHLTDTAAKTRPGDPPRARARHVQSCGWTRRLPGPPAGTLGSVTLAAPLSVESWPRPGRASGLTEPERAGGTGTEVARG